MSNKRHQYKQHLCEIICMVFQAEDAINTAEPTLRDQLREKKISPDKYVEKIADEILAHTPDNLIPNE